MSKDLPTPAEITDLVDASDLDGLVGVYTRLATSSRVLWMSVDGEYMKPLERLAVDDVLNLAQMLMSARPADGGVRNRLSTAGEYLRERWRRGSDLEIHASFVDDLGRGWDAWDTVSIQVSMERLAAAGRPISGAAVATARRTATFFTHKEQFGRFVETLDDPVLSPGEIWADKVLEDLATLGPRWRDLVVHCATASTAKPTRKWEKETRRLVADIGDDVSRIVNGWLEHTAVGRSFPVECRSDEDDLEQWLDPYNTVAARGLVWTLALVADDADTARRMGRLVDIMLKKIPGVGPRAPKLANAAVYALSRMDGEHALGQLARLSSGVRFKGTLNQINTAMQAKAEALGVSRDEIDEMAVPTYGLTDVGYRAVELGDCRAEITVTTAAVLAWFNDAGKRTKTPPAGVKRDHADEIKMLKAGIKDINAMVSAQAGRIDRQFLLQREWTGESWRSRYDRHPLVGTLTRRLLWRVNGQTCGFADGAWRDLSDKPVEITDSSRIELWHPIGEEVVTVTAWREWLERHEIVQPFKQAHREIYLLTAAEESTHTYSNRFGAHILRQHQFNALAASRGWRNRLRLMFDDVYEPPFKELPAWGLRAEFRVEGVGEHDGVDFTDAGAYLRLVTDQVRFYELDPAHNAAHEGGGGTGSSRVDVPDPVPLNRVPPLVLSEILRDVDLFVGVSSIGNDPTWSDGGPEGRHLDYWRSYGFGELEQTGKTRRDLLHRLVPRLAIRERARVEGRFLVVRGDLRTYKIHMGSGNILMDPNDQYLCIVPGQLPKKRSQTGFLPFEGDGVLAVILSKAIMLADDTSITDPTITSQLRL